MPRKPRLVVVGYPHHIVQRGHNRGHVFVVDGDRLAYLATLRECRDEFGIKVYGYCLMTNHVHLIVDPGADAVNVSELMKRLAGRHTQRFNRLESRTGTAWEGRFKCSPIDSNGYLLACTRYVDLNPVRAGLVRQPEHYPWSSYRARIGLTACEWLDVDPCYLALASTAAQRQRRYREFVEQGIHEHELALIRAAVQRNQLTGPDSFASEIEQRIGQRILNRAPGRPRRSKTGPIEKGSDPFSY
jgi:putative transposase